LNRVNSPPPLSRGGVVGGIRGLLSQQEFKAPAERPQLTAAVHEHGAKRNANVPFTSLSAMTPVPVADYVMVLCSFPDYNEFILRFEEYILKEGCYGILLSHSEISQIVFKQIESIMDLTKNHRNYMKEGETKL